MEALGGRRRSYDLDDGLSCLKYRGSDSAPRFGLKKRRITIRRDCRRLSDIVLLVFMRYSSLVVSAGSSEGDDRTPQPADVSR